MLKAAPDDEDLDEEHGVIFICSKFLFQPASASFIDFETLQEGLSLSCYDGRDPGCSIAIACK